MKLAQALEWLSRIIGVDRQCRCYIHEEFGSVLRLILHILCDMEGMYLEEYYLRVNIFPRECMIEEKNY